MFCHRFIDRRDAHHDLWASEEIQAKYRDWPHDPKDQRFEALTERIQSQCNFLASVFSSERRVYGVKAAYYDGSPTVLAVIEDSDQPLPVVSKEQMFFPVHVFHGDFRWTCDTSSTKPPSPPNNYTHAGTLITLIPPMIAPESIPLTNSSESTIPPQLLPVHHPRSPPGHFYETNITLRNASSFLLATRCRPAVLLYPSQKNNPHSKLDGQQFHPE
ncbi:hypothetical protein EV359DRAFT_82093 [Lentinula novae-zelandiae]|nr:hypothetical protein EV359DRAFT_82093 [Lentinula novae-zelandiae]